jgi:hypothetical protein
MNFLSAIALSTSKTNGDRYPCTRLSDWVGRAPQKSSLQREQIRRLTARGGLHPCTVQRRMGRPITWNCSSTKMQILLSSAEPPEILSDVVDKTLSNPPREPRNNHEWRSTASPDYAARRLNLAPDAISSIVNPTAQMRMPTPKWSPARSRVTAARSKPTSVRKR